MFWRCTRYSLIGQLWNCSRGEGSPQIPPPTLTSGAVPEGKAFHRYPPTLSVYLELFQRGRLSTDTPHSICESAVLQYCRFTEAAPSVSLPLCLSVSQSQSLCKPLSVKYSLLSICRFTEASISQMQSPDYTSCSTIPNHTTKTQIPIHATNSIHSDSSLHDHVPHNTSIHLSP